MQAVIYQLQTGEILRTVNTRQPAAQCGPGEWWLDVAADPATQFVLDGQVRPKQAMALVVTDHAIAGLPPGAVVCIDGRRYPVSGALIRFAFSLPGPYRAKVTAPGYIAQDVELAALGGALDGVAHDASYIARRVQEYPDVRDQLDAIMKGGADLEAMRQRVLAVKAKFPRR